MGLSVLQIALNQVSPHQNHFTAVYTSALVKFTILAITLALGLYWD